MLLLAGTNRDICKTFVIFCNGIPAVSDGY
jgi:hypothetical protein